MGYVGLDQEMHQKYLDNVIYSGQLIYKRFKKFKIHKDNNLIMHPLEAHTIKNNQEIYIVIYLTTNILLNEIIQRNDQAEQKCHIQNRQDSNYKTKKIVRIVVLFILQELCKIKNTVTFQNGIKRSGNFIGNYSEDLLRVFNTVITILILQLIEGTHKNMNFIKHIRLYIIQKNFVIQEEKTEVVVCHK